MRLYTRRRNVAAQVAEELKTVKYSTPPMEERIIFLKIISVSQRDGTWAGVLRVVLAGPRGRGGCEGRCVDVCHSPMVACLPWDLSTTWAMDGKACCDQSVPLPLSLSLCLLPQALARAGGFPRQPRCWDAGVNLAVLTLLLSDLL